MTLFYATLSIKNDDGTIQSRTLKSRVSLQILFRKFATAVSRLLFDGNDITEMKAGDMERKFQEQDPEENDSNLYIRNLLVNGNFENLKMILSTIGDGEKYQISYGFDPER